MFVVQFPAEELPALRVGDLVPSSGDGKLRAMNRQPRFHLGLDNKEAQKLRFQIQ